jgi:hypothetical protein
MDLKARCFDYLADLLLEHASLLYRSAELIAAFGHIPGSRYNATLEATAVYSHLRSAFFHVTNLVGLGFRDRDGAPITGTIDSNLDTRPAGIYYFAFRSSVSPTTTDPRLTIPVCTIKFCLALPQTTRTIATTSACRNLDASFASPPEPTLPVGPIPAVTLNTYTPTALLAVGASTGTDQLSDYATDCYPSFSADQFRNLLLRSHTPTTSTVPNTLAIQSPRMAAVLASAGSSTSGGHAYYCTLNFLDTQSCFDSTFPHATPLLVSSATLGTTVIDSVAVAITINAFVDQCKFQLFLPIFCTGYIGTADRNDAASLHATVQAIKKLAISYRNPISGHWVNLTPDDLFAEYSALTPLLPDNVQLWGLNLVTQFHDGLSPDLQDMILADTTYLPPNLSLLTT